MSQLKHTVISALLLFAIVLTGYASPTHKHKPFLRALELGFYGKSEIGFSKPKPARLSFKQPELFIRLPLGHQFKAEVSISREMFFNQNNPQNKTKERLSPYQFSIPVSVQYYFNTPNSKIHPFIGVGSWLYTKWGSSNNCPNKSNDGYHELNQTYRGPNYISVFITQGITIEVNPHLQITPSIHIFNKGDNANMELSVGVGYRLP